MPGHSRYAPSSAKRNMNCSGALALCDSLPEFQRSVAGEAALRGTAAHKLVEHCLENGKETVDFRDWIIEVTDESAFIRRNNVRPIHNGRIFEVDNDMIDAADVAVSYVRDRCEELKVDEAAVQLETRTNPLPDRDDTSGTADITIDAWPELLEVVDYKNGYLIVEVEDNEQLLSYLLGKAVETGFRHEKYKVTVVQPNAGHESGRVRSFDYTAKQLKEFQKKYRHAVERCDDAKASPRAPKTHKEIDSDWAVAYLKAGKHCFWCDAQSICPKRRSLAQEQARMDFADEPPSEEAAIVRSEEECADILKWAPYFDALFRSATGFAQRAMEHGFEVPGFKLVYGRSIRKFRDDMSEKQIVDAIKAAKLIKNLSALYTKPKLISGPQAEALVDKRRRKEFSKMFLTKPRGRLTVARENDPREGVAMGAAADFDAFDGEE